MCPDVGQHEWSTVFCQVVVRNCWTRAQDLAQSNVAQGIGNKPASQKQELDRPTGCAVSTAI